MRSEVEANPGSLIADGQICGPSPLRSLRRLWECGWVPDLRRGRVVSSLGVGFLAGGVQEVEMPPVENKVAAAPSPLRHGCVLR